jgi:hypothetical protein
MATETNESRTQAFNTAFDNIHVTAATEPGFFDKFDDPIAALGKMQKGLKNHAITSFNNSGVNPEDLKNVDKVVLHQKEVFGVKGLRAAHVSGDSSVHVNINDPHLKEGLRHEVGHAVNEHIPPDELAENLTPEKQHNAVGGYEAEADHFANPGEISRNTYVHAAVDHISGKCTKPHGPYSHQMLKGIGQGYLDKMGQISPDVHKELLGRRANNGD